MQNKVSFCLWPSLGYLVGAIKRSRLATAYAGPGSTWERPHCKPRLATNSTRPGAAQQKAQAARTSQPLKALGGLGFGWGGVSENHQSGMCGVHQVNADSVLAPVVRLGPLSKRFKAYWEQLPLTWSLRTPESCSRNTAVQTNASWLLPKQPP